MLAATLQPAALCGLGAGLLFGTTGVLIKLANQAVVSPSVVQRALLAFAGMRTVIAVAHRLSTVMSFDRVIVLHDGHVVEDGPPQALVRNAGYFAATWRLQHRMEGMPQQAGAAAPPGVAALARLPDAQL